jgi:VCBS repeat-containing protein
VSASYTDPDIGDTHSFAVDATGTLGHVTGNGNGTFSYDPNGAFASLKAGATATDTFHYTVTDAAGLSSTALVTITVTGQNDAPVAGNLTGTVLEHGPATTVTASYTDPDTGDTHSFAVDATGTLGHVTGNGNGTFSYDPNGAFASLKAGATATDTFHYTVTDAAGLSSTALVTITVTGQNDAPVAHNDSATTAENQALVLGASALLANDTDVEGDTLTLAGVLSPSHGTVSYDTTTRQVTFTPDANYSGAAGFDYTATDGQLNATGHVAVTVTPVNHAPVAQNDSATTAEDHALVLGASALLANDTDVDGDTLTLSGVLNPSHGTVSYNTTTRQVTFTPDANYSGAAGFDYKVTDGQLSATGHVAVTVTPVNDAPVAQNDSATTAEDHALVLGASALLANDTDVDGDTLTLSGVLNPSHGTVSYNTTTRQVTFTPDANYNGAAGFDYTISDGQLSATGHVAVTVTPVNDPPVANANSVTATKNQALVIPASALLANDTDVDNDTLVLKAVSNPTNGTVSFNAAAGTVTFTPTNGFTGTAGFDYQISDGTATASAHVTVTVNATATNHPPVAVADTASTDEDTPIKIAVLANDTDPDQGAVLSVAGLPGKSALGAELSINRDGTVQYDPTGASALKALPAGQTATDTFTYTVKDEKGATSTATVTVTVHGVNDPPVAVADRATTSEDTAVKIDVLANDTDPDHGAVLSVASVDAKSIFGATLTRNADGTITYDPTRDQFLQLLGKGQTLTDAFQYTVKDQFGRTSTTTVTVTVTGKGDSLPGFGLILAFLNQPFVIPAAFLLAHDTSGDGNPLQLTGGFDEHGQLSYDPKTGLMKFTPDQGFTEFRYRITNWAASSSGKLDVLFTGSLPHHDATKKELPSKAPEEPAGGLPKVFDLPDEPTDPNTVFSSVDVESNQANSVPRRMDSINSALIVAPDAMIRVPTDALALRHAVARPDVDLAEALLLSGVAISRYRDRNQAKRWRARPKDVTVLLFDSDKEHFSSDSVDDPFDCGDDAWTLVPHPQRAEFLASEKDGRSV